MNRFATLPAKGSDTVPAQVALLASPYPDGLLLAQSLRVLSGGQVNWMSCPDAFWHALQCPDAPAPTDLLVCDHATCGADPAGYCHALAGLGLGPRLVLLADAQTRQAALSGPHPYPAGMRWLLRPWRLTDLGLLLGRQPQPTGTA